LSGRRGRSGLNPFKELLEDHLLTRRGGGRLRFCLNKLLSTFRKRRREGLESNHDPTPLNPALVLHKLL
jgi:hypothetical protein